jgi:thymidylate synthase (FAD)
MNVKLVSLTQPHPNMGDMNCEDLIAYCARVSNPSNQNNTETAPNLLKYLIKHKHWSPFEMASMTVEIKTSRAIAAQILRHRSFSFQEFSQRYSVAQELEEIQLRKQAEKNRQSSTDEFTDSFFLTKVREHLGRSVSLYNEAIKKGVAKESARLLLPLTTETTMYMSGTIRSWVHYIDLRSQEDTQKEHRDIAEGCRDIFVEHFPNISLALGWKE